MTLREKQSVFEGGRFYCHVTRRGHRGLVATSIWNSN